MTDMEYIEVCWIHDFEDEPQVLYHEIDSKRNEIRKIEIYADGSFGIASKIKSFGGAELSIEEIPTIEEINSDSQFKAKKIDKLEFEEQWSNYESFLNFH
jgi:uncharacterized Zn finger protein